MNATETLTPAATRRAGLFAAVGAALLGGGALALPALTLPHHWSTDDDVVTSTVIVVAAAALLRLAWICACTAGQLRTEARMTTPAPPAGYRDSPACKGRVNTRVSLPRSRAARFFVAVATVTMLSAPAAHASTASTPTPVATASVTPGVEAPSPGFSQTPSHQPTDDATFTVTTPEVEPAVGAPPPPVPGWTPSTQTILPAASPLALGVVRPELPDAARVHVVMRGESLWSIAASRLGANAPAEQVAEAVQEWLEANPDLRPAPDVIHPGHVLVVPGSPDPAPSFASTTGDLR